MKLIIDIPDETYEIIGNINYFYNMSRITDRIDKQEIVLAIKNGTPLPKGHGRLIDVDELRLDIIAHKYSNNFCAEHNIDQSINVGMLNILIADAPTIIEADKENKK